MITLLNKFDDEYIMQKKDVLEIIDYYVQQNNLQDYIKDIDFDINHQYMGSYNIKKKTIVINDVKVLTSCHEIFNDVAKIYGIDNDYSSYFVNFYYLYILFHEMQHAIQTKDYELMSKNKLSCYLYEMCYKLQDNNQTFYDKNHSLFPLEIEANNLGYMKAYELLSYTKLPKRETKIMYLQYLFSLLANYEKINHFRILTPIEKLQEENPDIDLNLIFKILDEVRLSKIERFNLGVCITPNEFNSVEHEKRKILCQKGMLLK